MSAAAPLTWGSFLGSWRLEPGWLALRLLLVGGYAALWLRAGTVCISFLNRLPVDLLLIMALPVLLLLGHP